MTKMTIFRSMVLSVMTTGVMMTGFSLTGNSNNEMVAMCHIPDDEFSVPKTVRIPSSEINNHLSHGDYLGFCQMAPDFDRTMNVGDGSKLRVR